MKSKSIQTICALVLTCVPYLAYGQIQNPTKFQSLEQIVLEVVNVVQILLIMATVLYLLYAGLMFVTARGEPAKITKARDALLWGMVGAALVLAARVLVTTLQTSVNNVLN